MNKTALALLSLVAVTATSGVASARTPQKVPAKGAPVPICNFLVGAKGAGKTLLAADDQLDILSADIGSDKVNFTVVLRLANLAPTDLNTPGGRNYYLQFTAPGQPNTLYVSAGIDPVQDNTAVLLDTQTFDFGALVPAAGGASTYTSAGTTATGKIDYTAHTITINVPVAAWSTLAKMNPGVVLSAVEADATYVVGVAGTGLIEKGNTVAATKSFTLGVPTCVVPGKLG